jgi:aryl-alcohol dehydrogenase-like predicted oxidoreductase
MLSNPGKAQSTVAAKRNPAFVLGTVQLGLHYGIANRSGLPDEDAARDLLRHARAAGVRTVDTARAYGLAEARIGAAFADAGPPVEIVTKLDPINAIASDAPAGAAVEAVRESIRRSLAALRREHLDVLLLHRAAHRSAWGGAAWNELRRQRDAGAIGRLGVSVATPAEAFEALGDCDVAHLQLPFNVLDGRWERAGVPDAVRRRRDVVVHARSIFLQGLLADSPGTIWPPVPDVDGDRILSILRRQASDLGYRTVASLCAAFVRGQEWIDGLVIGVETLPQLAANLECWRERPMEHDEISRLASLMPGVDERLLDPSRWHAAQPPYGAR